MENAKHIGGMWALAVALGVGMAVANTPAVALAAPADSGKGSSSGDSSASSSSRHSDSTSSDTSSKKNALSAANDAPRRHRRPLNPPGETAMSSSGRPQTSTTRGTDARQRGGAAFRLGSGPTAAKTSPNPTMVNTLAADPTVGDNSLDSRRPGAAGRSSIPSITRSPAATSFAALEAPVASSAAAPAMPPPPSASRVITPARAHPVSRIVSTLINAVLSPFAKNSPTVPVQSPAALTLLAFARREFEPAVFRPSTTVDRRAGHITNGLVTDTVGSTPAAACATVDPGFISSTRNIFGLLSITSAADPDDNFYVAVVLKTPIFTFVLTSGADPEDNLGLGAASIGIAGHTVGTFISPLLSFSVAIPIEDPFARLFTELIRLGLV